MFIGNKNTFAIEILIAHLENRSLVPLKIWVCNHSIGTFDDVTYIDVFLGKLEFRIKNLYPIDFYYGNTKIFDNIHKDENRFEKYQLSLGDSFDDYYIYIYIYNNQTHISWKIVEEPFFNYPEKETLRVFTYVLDTKEVLACVEKLRSIIQNKC